MKSNLPVSRRVIRSGFLAFILLLLFLAGCTTTTPGLRRGRFSLGYPEVYSQDALPAPATSAGKANLTGHAGLKYAYNMVMGESSDVYSFLMGPELDIGLRLGKPESKVAVHVDFQLGTYMATGSPVIEGGVGWGSCSLSGYKLGLMLKLDQRLADQVHFLFGIGAGFFSFSEKGDITTPLGTASFSGTETGTGAIGPVFELWLGPGNSRYVSFGFSMVNTGADTTQAETLEFIQLFVSAGFTF